MSLYPGGTDLSDGKAIREDRTAAIPAGASNTTLTCDYIFNSTIPDQAGGSFWSVLNRVFICKRSLWLV